MRLAVIKQLEAEIKEQQARLRSIKDEIEQAIRAGADVEEGPFRAFWRLRHTASRGPIPRMKRVLVIC